MTVSDKGVLFTAFWEGLSLKPYLCPAKVPTIGYGATFYEDGTKVTLKDKPITKERALSMLKAHMAHFAQTVDSYTTDKVSQAQFDSLVDFAYNAGLAALKASTLLKKVNTNPNDPTIANEFAKWVYGGDGSRNGVDDDKDGVVDEPGEKQRLKGLENRRVAEANLYHKAIYLS